MASMKKELLAMLVAVNVLGAVALVLPWISSVHGQRRIC